MDLKIYGNVYIYLFLVWLVTSNKSNFLTFIINKFFFFFHFKIFLFVRVMLNLSNNGNSLKADFSC